MGSLIRLVVGNFEVDWGKNDRFIDHGPLFQLGDIKLTRYEYVDAGSMKNAFVRPLHKVLPRLELLGHSLDAARAEFEQLHRTGLYDCEIEFDQLAAALKKLDARKVSSEYSDDYDFGEFFSREIADRLTFNDDVKGANSRRIGEMMENLNPWNILRLVAENPVNLDCPVTWYYADVVDEGWAEESSMLPNLLPAQRFLIVTEGSTDAKILAKALTILRPEVCDFFYFVDMEEGYPFTGTGNLHRFCQGLASISVLNKVIILYDNDAEGVAKARETRELRLPDNIRVLQLPDLPEFKVFSTIGPTGESMHDINGKAAAIECYLDLRWHEQTSPVVRWTSFNQKLGCYQGILINKEAYVRRFLGLTRVEPGYDFARLTEVLDLITRQCSRMSTPA
jgi:hypothetical protein